MIDKFINELIENTLTKFLEDFDTKDKEYNEIRQAYIDFIISSYKKLDINESNYEKMLPIFINKEINSFSYLTVNQKKSMYLKDENLEKLIEISNKGMELKLQKQKDNKLISKEYAEECIHQMNQLMNLVKPYNGEIAQKYVSEGILDYQYAAGLTEFNSFRTGNYNFIDSKQK